MKKILIGITTSETVHYETMEALFNMKRPKDTQVDLKVVKAYHVSKGRTELVNYARSMKYDYIFFVDSDVVVPVFALERLLEAKTLVINGTYPRKEKDTLLNPNPFTTLYRHDRRGINKYNFGPFFMSQIELPQSGVVPVDAAGLGCTLIDMRVFDMLGDIDWFHFGTEEAKLHLGTYCLGEDLFFYRECLRHDIQPYAEGSVRCGHVGTLTFTLPEK